MSLINAKLRVSMLYYETENLLKVSDSKFINAEHVLAELKLIKSELEED